MILSRYTLEDNYENIQSGWLVSGYRFELDTLETAFRNVMQYYPTRHRYLKGWRKVLSMLWIYLVFARSHPMLRNKSKYLQPDKGETWRGILSSDGLQQALCTGNYSLWHFVYKVSCCWNLLRYPAVDYILNREWSLTLNSLRFERRRRWRSQSSFTQLIEVSGEIHVSAVLSRREGACGIHCTGGWVGFLLLWLTVGAQSSSSVSTQGVLREVPVFPHREYSEQFQFFHTGSTQGSSSFSTQGAHRAVPVFPHRERTEHFHFFHTGSTQSNSSVSTQGAHRALPLFPHREHTEQFQFFHTGSIQSSSSVSTRGRWRGRGCTKQFRVFHAGCTVSPSFTLFQDAASICPTQWSFN